MPLVQILSQLFAGDFVRGFCQGVFCLEGFVRGGVCPFPLLSEYICYDKKLNITLNFMFHMYDKKIYKCDVNPLYPPLPSVTNYHTFSDSLPLDRDVRPPTTSFNPFLIHSNTTPPFCYLVTEIFQLLPSHSCPASLEQTPPKIATNI